MSLEIFISQFASSAIHSVLVHPLERLRGLLAVKNELVAEERLQDDTFIGPFDCVLWQIHTAGAASLSHGSLETIVLSTLPSFLLNSLIPRRATMQWFGFASKQQGYFRWLAWTVLSGATQSFLRLLVTLPFSHAAVKMTHDVQVNGQYMFANPGVVYRRAFAEGTVNGIFQVYRGLSAALLGVITYRATYFMAGDLIPKSIDARVRPLLVLLPACVLSLPFDVVRRRVMQLPVADRRSAVTYACDVYENEGAAAFFAGWELAVLQTAVGSGLYAFATHIVSIVKETGAAWI
eukprot:m.165200 g.165200  ORF g.165200 m.165200 type:complete len:292 (+) comp16589_c1_seq9:98-973(+)